MRRILFLTPDWPLGHRYGGQLRALQTARVLKELGSLRIVVIDPEPDWEAKLTATLDEFSVLPPVPCVEAPNRTLTQKLRRAFDPRYLNVHGILATRADRMRVERYCCESDLVWVLSARVPNLLHKWLWPASHLDVNDLPSTYLRSLRRISPSALQATKTSLFQVLMRRREQTFTRRFTTLSVCSNEDRDYLGGGDDVHVIPNGFARPTIATMRNPSAEPRIGFIGLGSYEPNRDGASWFLRKCWPTIHDHVPGVRLRLAGRGFDHGFNGYPGIDVLGEILDSPAEISTWRLMIVPIRLGAGTRIKIAEAFSQQCPVVSTTLGALGYQVTDGVQLLLADTAERFATACIELLQHPDRAALLAQRAFADYLKEWTWEAIAPRIRAAAEACLRKHNRIHPGGSA